VSAFTVAVPCSTSNLGSGFDAVGIALGGPHLLVRVTPGGAELRIARISGEGEARLARDASNRLIQAAHLAAEAAGRAPGELRAQLEVHSSIPLRRGLGSSAAAALAGAESEPDRAVAARAADFEHRLRAARGHEHTQEAPVFFRHGQLFPIGRLDRPEHLVDLRRERPRRALLASRARHDRDEEHREDEMTHGEFSASPRLSAVS